MQVERKNTVGPPGQGDYLLCTIYSCARLLRFIRFSAACSVVHDATTQQILVQRPCRTKSRRATPQCTVSASSYNLHH